jgi:GTP cyclohydrolase I
MNELIRKILEDLGEDPDRQGLKGTPRRVEQALRFLTSGYTQNPDELLNNALFDVQYDEMVIVANIDFFSMCESYASVLRKVSCRIPSGWESNRNQQDCSSRGDVQPPPPGAGTPDHGDRQDHRGKSSRWVLAWLLTQHMCMQMRGVEKQNSRAITSSMWQFPPFGRNAERVSESDIQEESVEPRIQACLRVQGW